MTEQNSWSRYIAATCNGDLNSVIAEKVHVDPATIGRWRTGSFAPKPRQVVEYARAYGLSPISSLVAAGYVTAEELNIVVSVPTVSLADFSSSDIVAELAKRIRDTEPARTVAELFPPTEDVGFTETHISV